jgi:hypothetical protein
MIEVPYFWYPKIIHTKAVLYDAAVGATITGINHNRTTVFFLISDKHSDVSYISRTLNGGYVRATPKDQVAGLEIGETSVA